MVLRELEGGVEVAPFGDPPDYSASSHLIQYSFKLMTSSLVSSGLSVNRLLTLR